MQELTGAPTITQWITTLLSPLNMRYLPPQTAYSIAHLHQINSDISTTMTPELIYLCNQVSIFSTTYCFKHRWYSSSHPCISTMMIKKQNLKHFGWINYFRPDQSIIQTPEGMAFYYIYIPWSCHAKLHYININNMSLIFPLRNCILNKQTTFQF